MPMQSLRTADETARLMADYAPRKQAAYSHHPERCVTGHAPTLWDVRRTYGGNVALVWTMAQVGDFANMAMTREERKPDENIVEQLAGMIIARYGYLKLSEVMLFFARLKYGDYGRLYGCVNPIDILAALRLFLSDRAALAVHAEQAERQRRAEEERRQAVPMPERIRKRYEKLLTEKT